MRRILRFAVIIFYLPLILSACRKVPALEMTHQEPTYNPLMVPASTLQITDSPMMDAVESPGTNNLSEYQETLLPTDYGQCGTGELIQVPYFFTDINGNISPTQFMRSLTTEDGIRKDAVLSSCLLYDSGWMSKPEEVENGYENVIIFFDKYGKGHQYRIIIGGHYIAPYDPKQKDIKSSLNGMDYHYYYIGDWIETTRGHFQENQVRQIGVSIYIEGH